MSETPFDQNDLVIDARNLACPMPLLKAKQGLNQLAQGQVLALIATDPGSWRDLHSFIELTDHRLLLAEQDSSEFRYLIEKH